jgi:hypothetical protein
LNQAEQTIQPTAVSHGNFLALRLSLALRPSRGLSGTEEVNFPIAVGGNGESQLNSFSEADDLADVQRSLDDAHKIQLISAENAAGPLL